MVVLVQDILERRDFIMTPLEIYLHFFNWRYVAKLEENDSGTFPTLQ